LGDFFQGNSAQTNCLNIFRKFYFFNWTAINFYPKNCLKSEVHLPCYVYV
jgi:hypothetical protein